LEFEKLVEILGTKTEDIEKITCGPREMGSGKMACEITREDTPIPLSLTIDFFTMHSPNRCEIKKDKYGKNKIECY